MHKLSRAFADRIHKVWSIAQACLGLPCCRDDKQSLRSCAGLPDPSLLENVMTISLLAHLVPVTRRIYRVREFEFRMWL